MFGRATATLVVAMVMVTSSISLAGAAHIPSMEDFVTGELNVLARYWEVRTKDAGYTFDVNVGYNLLAPGERVSSECGTYNGNTPHVYYCAYDTFELGSGSAYGVLYLPVTHLNEVYTGGGGSYTDWNGPGVVQTLLAVSYGTHLSWRLASAMRYSTMPSANSLASFRYCVAGVYVATRASSIEQALWDMRSLLNLYGYSGDARQVRDSAFAFGFAPNNNPNPQVSNPGGLSGCVDQYWPA